MLFACNVTENKTTNNKITENKKANEVIALIKNHSNALSETEIMNKIKLRDSLREKDFKNKTYKKTFNRITLYIQHLNAVQCLKH